MRISSRTPEGLPNRCPICGNEVCIEPSLPFGDAPCPHCGHLLWFIAANRQTQFFIPANDAERRDRVMEIIAEQLGVSADELRVNSQLLNELGDDSLDMVELAMALEEEFGNGY